MALKIEEFNVNYTTAVGRKSVNGLKFANFRYKNSDHISFRELSFIEEWNESDARKIWKLL